MLAQCLQTLECLPRAPIKRKKNYMAIANIELGDSAEELTDDGRFESGSR